MKAHIETITDLLLGAAYADKRLQGDEIASISRMLCKLLGESTLPAAQQQRLSSFNPAKFDIDAATKKMRADLDSEDKRRLLELIASVNDADEELDFAEDAYLRRVAEGLGLSEDEIDDLTLDVLEEDDLDQFFEE